MAWCLDWFRGGRGLAEEKKPLVIEKKDEKPYMPGVGEQAVVGIWRDTGWGALSAMGTNWFKWAGPWASDWMGGWVGETLTQTAAAIPCLAAGVTSFALIPRYRTKEAMATLALQGFSSLTALPLWNAAQLAAITFCVSVLGLSPFAAGWVAVVTTGVIEGVWQYKVCYEGGKKIAKYFGQPPEEKTAAQHAIGVGLSIESGGVWQGDFNACMMKWATGGPGYYEYAIPGSQPIKIAITAVTIGAAVAATNYGCGKTAEKIISSSCMNSKTNKQEVGVEKGNQPPTNPQGSINDGDQQTTVDSGGKVRSSEGKQKKNEKENSQSSVAQTKPVDMPGSKKIGESITQATPPDRHAQGWQKNTSKEAQKKFRKIRKKREKEKGGKGFDSVPNLPRFGQRPPSPIN